MADDPDRLTLDSVELLVSGMLYSSFPSGSFEISPEQPLQLFAVLEPALRACGLGDRAKDVYLAIRDQAMPAFQAEVDRMEKARLRIREELGEP